MESEYTLSLASPQASLETVGGKGASLARLANAGLPVPGGFHISTAAYNQFVAQNDLQPRILAALAQADVAVPSTLESAARTIDELFAQAATPPDIAGAIATAYARLGEQPAVAVRSSATAEDLPDLSFAGQQETFLNVVGVQAVQAAVKRCWASLWTARAIGYRARHGVDHNAVSLAVVVQLMVPAEAAGIMFTANPVSGNRQELVINAAWGLGQAIVGDQVSPDTIVADKASGQVVHVEVAEKSVMTIPTAEGTAEQAVADSMQRARVLNDEQAAELARLGALIETLYGMPMDIEWALAANTFAILQARPITALPTPEPPPPAEWKLPKGCYAAMRNNIVELMADPLTPLFGSLGRAAINTSLHRLLTQFFGKPGIMPEEMIITVNEYAYYNGSLKAGPILQILWGSVGIAKRMFTGAVERWTEAGRPRYIAAVEHWQAQAWRTLPATEILGAVRQLAEAAIDAYGALVSGVIPAAWISEALFTVAYDRLIKRRDDPPAPTFLLGFDSIPIQAEKSLYDLAQWARGRAGLASYLGSTPTQQLATQLDGPSPPTVEADDWREWQSRFKAHLQRYGHTLYDLDFANPVPADDPAPLLETCKLFIAGRGADPHARQQAAAERREQATQAVLGRLKGLRLRLWRKLIAPAQRFAPLREDALAEIGLGYPLLRQMLRELGQRLVGGGMIEKPDDIFWLIQPEVEQAAASLERGEALGSFAAGVSQRKAAWRAARRAAPPIMLPQMKIFGFDLMQLRAKRARGNTFKGVAASPGNITAPACVLRGPEDFGQMRPGHVLVAAITTPAWTPLFAMASAVVTDVGGPLSHGSIVAREYGIPAVLGTGVATRKLKSGDRVRVDGGRGLVEILE